MVEKRPLSPTRAISPPPTKRKVTSTATGTVVSNFFKPTSEKNSEQLQWRVLNKSLIIGKYVVDNTQQVQKEVVPCKIAAFDLDDTLIKSTAGKFTKSASGWKWWSSNVPSKLKALHEKGFRIVVLTNQGTISLRDDSKTLQKDKASFRNFKDQLTAVFRHLDLPISVYAATEKDLFRKPRTGMWKEMVEDFDLDTDGAVDIQISFLVGDAAGREKNSNRRKDHSCCDRDLAANVGIRFQTPEEFFLDDPPEPFARPFEPAIYLGYLEESASAAPCFKRTNDLDIVIFCGSPGAGKSTFYSRYLRQLGYERVNQDQLKTREKCLKVAAEHIGGDQSVAIDNTNANVETRRTWIELARRFKIPIRCVHFTASPRLCEHNDTVRSFNVDLMNPEKRTALPAAAFRGYASRYQEPSLEEGFQDISKVDFKFVGTAEQRDVWKRYWVSNYSS